MAGTEKVKIAYHINQLITSEFADVDVCRYFVDKSLISFKK